MTRPTQRERILIEGADLVTRAARWSSDARFWGDTPIFLDDILSITEEATDLLIYKYMPSPYWEMKHEMKI